MKASSIKIPLNIFEMNFLVYCPLENQPEGGVLIKRLNPLTFVFGFLKQNPTTIPFPEECPLFEERFSGFEWTCPKEYEETLLEGQLMIKDLTDDWEKLKTLRIDHAKTNFKPLTSAELNNYFPKEQIIIQRPQSVFIKETTQVKDLIPNQNSFFQDTYDGQWFINQMDESRLYIIEVSYCKEKNCLKIKSDLYLMKEELISFFDEYKGMKLIDLTLADLIILKNKTVEYRINHAELQQLDNYFTILPKQQIAEWMNPANYYFEQVSV